MVFDNFQILSHLLLTFPRGVLAWNIIILDVRLLIKTLKKKLKKIITFLHILEEEKGFEIITLL